MGSVVFEPIEGKLSNGNGHAPASVIRSYAPANGELIGEVPVHSPEAIAAVVARARRAQSAWSQVPLEERAVRLLRFRDALVERADEVVEVLSRECGKPRHEALAHEVATICDLTTYYCRNATRILARQTIDLHLLKHRKSTVTFVPRGVIGVISPWNYPFAIPMGDVIAALITGSAVVVKPSEVAPLTMKKAKEIYDSTGLPVDLFGVVYGYAEAGAALIDSGVQKLVFTGGVETGKKVAAACGTRLIPCVMELGGKAPLIACEDADLERTARAVVFGGFANCGQICISVERVYAHKAIYDALLGRCRQLVADLKQGDPAKDYVDVGAIIFARQIDVAERHIDDALRKGAELVAGGHRKTGAGQFFEPTLLGNCNHDMTVMTQEIFGPVVPFQKVDSDEEAIRLANSSHLGLNAYVFTKDRDKGRRIAEQIEAGSILVNDVLINHACPETPFGGVKESGFGRVHGDDALRDMAERKHINEARIPLPSRDPLWFPYTARSFHWMMRAVRAVFGRNSIVQRIGELF
jgi:acyl-CoA reductase-like NAD-dependent aldehyde dehydrogenase